MHGTGLRRADGNRRLTGRRGTDLSSQGLVVKIEGASSSPLRIELDAIGFVPSASKLYRPSPGLVSRAALTERVRRRQPDVVAVTAPAGYGKSTVLAELAAADPRPTAWLSVTAAEADPASLLTYIALAMDQLEPVDPGCVRDLW